MKYIITDTGEIRTDGMYHQEMADDCQGRVTSAGHYRVVDGKVSVYGESVGYGIEAKPEDALLLQVYLETQKNVNTQTIS